MTNNVRYDLLMEIELVLIDRQIGLNDLESMDQSIYVYLLNYFELLTRIWSV